MSEYQYVAFRAIDGPVTEKNLEYMKQQSSRAEVTAWAFDNEYNYSDFRGNALEMMRRGYDFHLHFANFGTHVLYFRLPQGLPDAKAAKPYLSENVKFVRDKQGPGGTLCIEPDFESGQLEAYWNYDELIPRLLPLRAEILAGDLRPLYLANLAVAMDMNHDPEETVEPPVPAGMDRISDAQLALAEFYEISQYEVAAAAQGCPPLPSDATQNVPQLEWLASQPPATKDQWLLKWMAEPNSPARREMLDAYHAAQPRPNWPTIRLDRLVSDLLAAGEELRAAGEQKQAQQAARKKAKRLAGLAANPTPILQQTEKLAKERKTKSYEEITEMLLELREALAGSDKAGLPEEQARKLKSMFPKQTGLSSALKSAGLLPK